MTTSTESPSAPGTPTEPRKKRSILKILAGICVVLAALFIIGLVVLYFSRNSLVRFGVVRGGKYATDQNTLLNAADLSIGAGTLKLMNLDINNLAGYKERNILSMKGCDVGVQSSSLLTHTVIVDHINIDGMELTLETNGTKNNLDELMDIVNKKTAATGNKTNSSPGKQLKINVIKLTGTKVHLRADPINLDLDLPDIEMTDPTNPDGRPMKIADLIGKILLNLSKQIVENPQIPAGIKDGMKNVTEMVNNLGKELDKGVKDLSKNLQDAGKGMQDAGKNTQKSLEDAGKGLQNLFNQKKDPGK